MLLDKLIRLGTITALVGSVWLYRDAARERGRAHAESLQQRAGETRDGRLRLGFDGERVRFDRRIAARARRREFRSQDRETCRNHRG
jgi:hypothetical protein